MSARKKRIAALAGYFQIALAVIGFVEVIRRFVGVEEMRDFSTMIIVSTLALIANGFCLYLLQKSKSKEAHMQASAIFTSNDVIINLGVITAGVLVYLLGSNKLDLVNRNNSICRGRSGSDEDFETRKMMIGYILVIYLVFYFGAAFVLPSYRVWKRTGVNPVTFRGADTARDYIGKLFKIVMLALALAVSFTPSHRILSVFASNRVARKPNDSILLPAKRN